MPVTPDPKVPSQPVALYMEPVLDLLKKVIGWTRWSVLASLVVGAAALGLTLKGAIHWTIAFPAFLLPLVPMAAQTRAEELRRKMLDQVRDRENEQIRSDAVGGKKSGP